MPSKNLQLFRISPDKAVHTAGGDLDPQRFVTDVQFISHYAAGFAECLGVHTISDVIIDDVNSQTAFFYLPAREGTGTLINGVITQTRHTPEELLEQLHEDTEDLL